ncbi:MAG: Asp23/Gls24 family envelope stress response protein [Bacteroides sp.]|nr:Asp23/Gls24 family envelope stress response protein [Eubacterium sp.]MCM1418832.1 Asp23/Gls24 family envelope stress response protein [Roseburia sp.]MCM1462106.1 Asp23/Gls24 family envelope stress response protein [Bacteroides sp.]
MIKSKGSPAVGSLKISGNAILRIAETAAAEVDGVALTEENRIAVPRDAAPFSRLLSPPVKVRISADAAVIELSVVVLQGYRAHRVALALQESVKSAVQNMTGIAVSKVNVKIAGICFDKGNK